MNRSNSRLEFVRIVHMSGGAPEHTQRLWAHEGELKLPSMSRVAKAKTSKSVVTGKRWERLQPFLKRREVRQRLMLYLLAANFTVGELVKLTRKELRGLSLHPEMATARDEMFELFPQGELAFVFPSGDPMKHTNIYRIIRTASQMVTGIGMSQEQFREYLDNSQ
jgi:hypothetical protein